METSSSESVDSLSDAYIVDENMSNLEKSTINSLSQSAILITQQIVDTSFHSSELKSDYIPFPDNNDISRFILVLAYIDSEDNPYRDYLTVDSEGCAHFPVNKCNNIVSELFQQTWTPANCYSWKYNEKNQEYLLAIEFEVKYGYEFKNIDVITDNKDITVVYELTTNPGFPEAELLGKFKTRYSVNLSENARYYLTHVETKRL